MEPVQTCERTVRGKADDTARLILERMEKVYPAPDGHLPRHCPAGPASIYADLDDLVPFLLYFGKDDFVARQIEISRRFTHQGLTVFNGKIVSWRIDEYLGALCAFYRKNGGDQVRTWIEESAESLYRYLLRKDHVIAYYDLPRAKASPVASPWAGGLIEVLLENSDLFPEWKDPAVRMLDSWLGHEPFVRYGLFASKEFIHHPWLNKLNNGWRSGIGVLNHPMWHSTGYYLDPSRGWKTRMLEGAFSMLYAAPLGFHFQFMKMNTSMIFALIVGFRQTGDERYRQAVRRWVEAVRTRLFVNGQLRTDWSPYHHDQRVSRLTDTFILIDVLCDAAAFLDLESEALEFASAVADGWLGERWECGLFPAYSGSESALLDNQVDFSIALRRLAELTGESKYRRESRAGTEAILELFPTDSGFASAFDRERGIDRTAPVDVKYNALLLKLLISELEETRLIYQDPAFHDLLKDR